MKKQRKVPISTTIPTEYYERLKKAMEKPEVTLSKIITTALERAYGFQQEQADLDQLLGSSN